MPIPLGVLAVAGAGAGAAGAYDLLETTLINTNTATITFSNLNNYSDYKHLQLRITARTNRAASVETVEMRFNADSGANYSNHYLNGTGSVVESFSDISDTQIRLGNAAAASATANIFTFYVCDILDFGNTNKAKTTRTFNGADGNNQIRLSSGRWGNTNAITSLALTGRNSGSFVSGTRVSLYGIK